MHHISFYSNKAVKSTATILHCRLSKGVIGETQGVWPFHFFNPSIPCTVPREPNSAAQVKALDRAAGL